MMTSTDSMSLNPVVLANQTTSEDLKEMSVVFTKGTHLHDSHKMQQSLFRTVGQFTNSTTDGGSLLTVFLLQQRAPFYPQQDNLGTALLSYLTFRASLIKLVSNVSRMGVIVQSIQLPRVEDNSPYLEALRGIKDATGFSWERIGNLIGVSRQAIHLWENGEQIKDINRRRLLAVRDVLERATRRYPTREQLTAWLDTPCEANGRTPADLLSMNEINRVRLLAVSSPSQQLKRPPAWVNRPIPETLLTRSEHRQEAWSPTSDDEILADLIKNEEEDGEERPFK